MDSGETMIKFQRLAQLSKDPEIILNALKKSTSQLMELCEESKKIRRSVDKPVPEDNEEYKQELKSRTVYCKGFPRGEMTIDDLLDFFKDFDGVENIKMRYMNDKQSKSVFKGSLSVTFSSLELAEKFKNLEEVKYKGTTLLRQWFADWEKEKEEQFSAKKKKNAKEKENVEEQKEDAKEETAITLPKGAILKLAGLPENIKREEIKQALSSYPAEVAFIEGPKDNTAFVRLRAEDDAKVVLSKIEGGKLKVNETDVDVSVLEGEDEEAYLKRAIENMNNSHQGGRGKKRFQGGRSRSGRGRGGWKGQKRSRSPGAGGPRGKKTRNQ
nr:EOG090X0CQA [Cyclestheria hislopi]